MAKDVDLSSNQWTDIVFEGKNKEYGAYEMRRKSDGRHNRAMLYVVIGVAVILLGAWGYSAYSAKKAAEAKEAAQTIIAMIEQEEIDTIDDEPEEEDIDEPEEEAYIPPEVEEVLPEEVLNTIMQTEITIKADDEVQEEVKTQDEILETTTAVGAVDFDKGTDDINLVREYREEVVVEEKKPVVENKVFEAVEQMPQFPGGDAELMKYLNKHIVYPTLAAENGIQGRVVIKFVVKPDGSI
ncbi:MAG: energy transducer TonB, partial [Muribaculaceae bacterium]|nr:energy transducer TonB [Muribaculaceae bacterium]